MILIWFWFILIFRLPCQVFFSTCRSTLDARHYLTWYKRRKNLACSSFNGPSGFGRSPCNRLRTTQLSCNFDDSDMVMDWRLSSGNRNSTLHQASFGYMGRPLPGKLFVLSGLGSTIWHFSMELNLQTNIVRIFKNKTLFLILIFVLDS
jgi:hypothetical protein